MAVGDAELLCSAMLGELLDRRSNTVGFRITQPFSGQLSLKIANRLSQGGRHSTENVRDLASFFGELRTALSSCTSRWYWFVNPDQQPPAGAELLRVEDIDGPNYGCFAGFNECVLIAGGDEVDIRDRQVVEVSEGLIGVASESANERFAPHLEEAIARLAACDPGQLAVLALVATDRRPSPGAWKTFSRKRLEKRAKPLSKIADHRLTPRLGDLGFRRAGNASSGEGFLVWVRITKDEPQYVAIDRNRFEAAFRVFLSVGGEPYALNCHRSAEMFAKSTHNYSFASQEGLEAALEAAWDDLVRVGLRWLENPQAHSRKEWLDLRVMPHG